MGSNLEMSLVDDTNTYLFNIGESEESYRFLGAHICQQGVRFAVWAPHAKKVAVIGDFNNWQGGEHAMQRKGESGIWELFIPQLKAGDLYKYEITAANGAVLHKADPYGFSSELRPATASRVTDLNIYEWQDEDWQQQKRENCYNRPMLIYELHLGSWKRGADNRFLTYRELADELPDYLVKMGYTHLELMPLMEHPLDDSWGYQVTGYYALTSRYGRPEDFMYLIDRCHQKGISVLLDWVPGHFCRDAHGLLAFDGEPLYESRDSLRSENREWGTANFDFTVTEVVSFLVSNAVFWLDVYHLDGFRVDAVSNMLYHSYGRENWRPNRYGGNENLEAIAFLRKVNEVVFRRFPNALMIAEEATAWPMVSWPTYTGGLGFNFKWNMGWMNDILRYMELDPIFRKWDHNLVTFSLMYAFSENFILPLSHDEVVHGKKSLLDKMPGDYWQKFANLRAFYGYWMAHPGKKLLFMGGEFGQFIEWKPSDSLDWHLLEYEMHKKLHLYVQELNHFYVEEEAFWENDSDWSGFSWIDCNNCEQSILCFCRKSKDHEVIVVSNFTPVCRFDYRIGVPKPGQYQEVWNSDQTRFGGSGQENRLLQEALREEYHGLPYSLTLTIPPLATIYLKRVLLSAKGEE